MAPREYEIAASALHTSSAEACLIRVGEHMPAYFCRLAFVLLRVSIGAIIFTLLLDASGL